MSERETLREREAESKPRGLYDELFRLINTAQKRAETGKIVIRGKDRPWLQSRQGVSKYYCHPAVDDTAVGDWTFFVQEIRTHSGRHRHQGGLAIYVVEGQGYTVVNGQRVDWKEGDLILLPIMPNGVEHQHFSTDPDKPARWLAMVPFDLQEKLGNELRQVEEAPGWKKGPSEAPTDRS